MRRAALCSSMSLPSLSRNLLRLVLVVWALLLQPERWSAASAVRDATVVVVRVSPSSQAVSP